MQSFVTVLFICLFIFLFFVFALAKEDFVLFRKNIALEKVFNFALLAISVSLFFARLIYVGFHFAPGFLHPLVFFIFPYFPGLSQAGGILGGMLFVLFFAEKSKLPMGRVFDIFSLSFLGTLPCLYILEQIALLLQKKHSMPFVFVVSVVYGGLFVFFYRLLEKNKFIDGSIGYMVALCVSTFVFLSKLLGSITKSSFVLGPDDLLLILVFFLSLLFLLQQEKIMPHLRKLHRH